MELYVMRHKKYPDLYLRFNSDPGERVCITDDLLSAGALDRIMLETKYQIERTRREMQKELYGDCRYLHESYNRTIDITHDGERGSFTTSLRINIKDFELVTFREVEE